MNKYDRIQDGIVILMKLSLIQAFTLTVFAAMAAATNLNGQQILEKEVSLNLENKEIKAVLHEISKQAHVRFTYSPEVIQSSRIVSLRVKNTALGEVLDELFGPRIIYTVVGREIVFKLKSSDNSTGDFAMRIQEAPPDIYMPITGNVVDENGDPLPGVNVVIKGTTKGSFTDAEGKFTVDVDDPSSAVLVFSFVGYLTQEVTIGNQTTLSITLAPDLVKLQEVVVVGYGTQKSVNLTGAVTQITSEGIQNRSISNLSQALQGMIPNLNVSIGSGEPGVGGRLNIRGNTSITSDGAPLVIIDGIPGDMDRINANDVESVTVLKDASASAIYGARGAFGVILITTKTPKPGKPVVSYFNNFGWKTHATNTNFLTKGYDFLMIEEESYYNALGRFFSGYTDEDFNELLIRRNDKTEHPDRPWVMVKPNAAGKDVYKYYGNFDWFNYLYDDWRPKQQHNVSLAGGTDNIKYLVTADVRKEQGIMNINPDIHKRHNLRSKVDIQVLPWLSIFNNTSFFSSNYTYYGMRGGNFPDVNDNLTSNHVYNLMPVYVPQNPDGSWTYLVDDGTYQVGYGFHIALANGRLKGVRGVNDFTTTFQTTINVTKGLTVIGNYSYNLDNSLDTYRAVRLKYSLYPGVIEQVPRSEYDSDLLTETMNNNRYHVVNVYGNYEKAFDRHNLSLVAGFNQEEKINKRIYAEGRELLSETLNDLNLTTGDQIIQGGASEWALRGYFYRVNYDYAGKYLVEASGRYDGTSRFKKGQRFGFFPSASVGWRLSEEPFFDPLTNIFNEFKLRASYGVLGNQQVGTYAYISSMSASLMSYLVNGQRIRSVSAPVPVASSLTWERAATKNLGVDVTLLRNRLSIVFDTYIRDTKGMLVPGKTLPAVFGASSPRENAADLRTKGFEFDIKWQDGLQLGNSQFSYSIGLILSDYTAKITKFDNPTRLLSNYYVGQQLGEIWGLTYDGFFQTTQEAQDYPVNQDFINWRRVRAPSDELRMLQAGDIKIVDINGDGKIDFGARTVDDPGDERIIGNSQPRYSFGIPISAKWRGIDLTILFQGVARQDYWPDKELQVFWGPYSRPYGSFLPANFGDMIWRPENPDAYFPRPMGYLANNAELYYENDMYLLNAAYTKLRNLTIGYSLPASLTSKARISNLRFYVTGENLVTWTKLITDYVDPEEVVWDESGRTYPMGKTYSFGVQMNF